MSVVREGLACVLGDVGDYLAFALMWRGVFRATLEGDGVVGGLTVLGLIFWTALNFRNYRRRRGELPGFGPA